jgi:DNA-binding beta-propeller fold protein YncE
VFESYGQSGNRSAKALRLGLAALVFFFFGCGFAHADTLYVSNMGNNTISKIDSNGNVTVFISTGLNHPRGLALDNSGNLYVANSGTIAKFDPSGNGTVFATNVGDAGLAFGSNGNLYSAVLGSGAIIQVSPNGQPVFPFWNANSPMGLAFDKNGYLYAANYYNNTIVRISPSGQSLIFASSGLNHPFGLAFDSSGNLYVANSGNNTIEKFDSSGNASFFASARGSPSGLAFDSSGNLYATDQSGMIKIDPSGHVSDFLPNGPLYTPAFIAIQVPEPATWALVAFAFCVLLCGRRLRRRSS